MEWELAGELRRREDRAAPLPQPRDRERLDSWQDDNFDEAPRPEEENDNGEQDVA